MTMTDDEFRIFVRKMVLLTESTGSHQAKVISQSMKTALADRGQVKGCHVGNKGMTPTQMVEWYAGQYVDIVESESWFAMNSFINSVDRFAPENAEDIDKKE